MTLVPACESSGPRGPLEPEPESEGSGSLEVTVTVVGTKPDPDGYGVVLFLASGEQPTEPIDSIGGTVRFAEVRTGTHSVRLDGLAANCSVTGTNPVVFTIDLDEALILRVTGRIENRFQQG